MPQATTGHVAIFTMVDSATGFTILHPVLNKTHHVVSKTLFDYCVPFFGIPDQKNSPISEEWFENQDWRTKKALEKKT